MDWKCDWLKDKFDLSSTVNWAYKECIYFQKFSNSASEKISQKLKQTENSVNLKIRISYFLHQLTDLNSLTK